MKFFGKIDLYIDKPPKDGSCILLDNTAPKFLERLLERVGGSPLSHVAVILYEDGFPWVYEAYPPVVRRNTWVDYMEIVLPHLNSLGWTKRQDGLNVFAWQPKDRLPELSLLKMKTVADQLLGVKYGLLINYVFGTKKLHCSEYGGIIYNAGGIIKNENKTERETPTSLHNKLVESGF